MAAQLFETPGRDVRSFTELEVEKNREPYYNTMPTSWAAPPTPQDSLASKSAPPSPPAPQYIPPSTPSREEGAFFGTGTAAVMAATATLATLATPEQTPPSPRRTRARNSSVGSHTRDSRMQQWLTDIPPTISPQERYLQGLDPKVDHPLHPLPLKLPAGRQSRLAGVGADYDLFKSMDLDAEDKENGCLEQPLHPGSDHNVLNDTAPMEGKKRHMLEEHPDGALGRKRARLFDPVRRFSQKLSTLSMSPALEQHSSTPRRSASISLEDAARQSSQLYRFSQLEKQPSHRNSLRMSLSRHSGSLRASGSVALRRMLQKAPTSPAPAPVNTGPAEAWTEGRADMIINVAFIGDAQVGKSALIRRLVHGTFRESYVPSEIQEQSIRLKVGESRVQLNLSEAGSARDPRQPSLLALGWFSVVVLCFDIGSQSSLEALKKYRHEIAMYEENSVVILAGLKKDARHRLPPLHLTYVEDTAQVSTEEGQEAAARLYCHDYFECSSLGPCDGMDDFFEYIVRSGVELHRMRDKKMARFRLEHSVDKGMSRIADGVRSLFLFPGSSAHARAGQC